MYAIVNKETRISTQFIECDEDTLLLNLPNDCFYIKYDGVPKSIKVDNDGNITELPEEEDDTKYISVFESKASELMKEYDMVERLTFYRQELEAREVLKDSNAYAPLLNAIATERNIDIVVLAKKVMEKANSFAEQMGTILGQRKAGKL